MYSQSHNEIPHNKMPLTKEGRWSISCVENDCGNLTASWKDENTFPFHGGENVSSIMQTCSE